MYCGARNLTYCANHNTEGEEKVEEYGEEWQNKKNKKRKATVPIPGLFRKILPHKLQYPPNALVFEMDDVFCYCVYIAK